MDSKNYDLLTKSKGRIDLYWSEKDKKHLGFVKVVDVMPRLVPEGRTGDMAVVQGARISYGSTELKSKKADDSLVSYLVEHYHTSPIELASVKFHINCPLYVFNQLVRHRTASLNCTSRRYKKVDNNTFYVPEPRLQDFVNNKQGSLDKPVPDKLKESYYSLYQKADDIYKEYENVVDNGIAKEIARGAMPQNIMTEFVWKCDLHNFIKMVRLRVHSTAQKEIRDLAEAMKDLVKPMFPVVFNAFEKYWLNSISLSQEEINIIKKGKDNNGNFEGFTSKRRQEEFNKKLKLLGL
jgi:thymidylate synthase (FAD)